MTSHYPDADPRGMYMAKEASELLGVSLRTFLRYVQRGYLTPKVHKATKRRRYSGADLNGFWKSNLI